VGINLENFRRESKSDFSSNQKVKTRLKKLKPKELDEKFEALHDAVFSKIDCLECANCCKTTSPIFLQTDIDRLAKVLKLKSNGFIDAYLTRDSDGDYVLKTAPCPFLDQENKCMVYHERPKACREYPHTNRKKMHGILDLSVRNTLVCPAVFKIFKQIDKDFRK
jgi:uncharacterized protein